MIARLLWRGHNVLHGRNFDHVGGVLAVTRSVNVSILRPFKCIHLGASLQHQISMPGDRVQILPYWHNALLRTATRRGILLSGRSSMTNMNDAA